MKLKLSEIYPNPYKVWINDGKLKKEQIDRLSASEKELGLMDGIPVVKRDGKYHCVSHHHRLEMMRQRYGPDHKVDVILHEYNDEQLFRGMVLENLTQRAGEFREEIENLVAIRRYLQEESCPDSGQPSKAPGKRTDLPFDGKGNVREISDWLNKNGEVMGKNKVHELLQMHDKLDPDLLETIEMTHEGDSSRRGEVLSKTQGVMLSSFDDKEEQKDLAKALLKSTEGRVREQSKLLTKFKEMPDDEKERIRKGEKDIALVGLGIHVETPPKLEKSASERINELTLAIGETSAHIRGFKMGLEDGDFKLSDEQKERMVTYLLSYRANVIDDLVTFLGK